ncbi:wd-repeat protein [Culex quinquefasciatus]|uniref:Wd-repeat protein n=1 Tax=Culex quinquefasciatus TaxID=7176 RepID=B0WNF4_CULQU|nr:wd-repeat protein [Culex quinquefasciatus]|eukprot:XP_001850238.1 wd-repeat protein [Culex quinquefasciatus]
MAESKRSSTTTTSSASTTNSSASSSSKSSRKSKNDLIRSVVGSYLKQRNYMITDRFRRSDLILTQSTEQIVMNSAIRNEISKANSFLFSNVFCLNNNPAQVEQHFVKLCNYIKSQPEPIRRELSELVNPLLCHLYIEMLKGRDWRPAIEFLRKHAPLLGKVEPSVTPPGSSPLIMNQKINGTVEEQQQSGIPAATVQSSAIVYSPPATTSSTDCPQLDTFQQLVHKLSQITRIQDLENDELTLQFRSCQYEIRLCSASVVALRRYLAKYGHSLILQILRSWFCFETSDDKDFVDYSPDTATAKATGKRPRLSTSSNGLDGINDMDYDDDEDDGTGYLPALEDIPTKTEPPFPEEQPHDDISGLFRRISSAERLRKLRECTDKLAQYQLPMCIYQVENVDDRLTAVAIDGTSCHLASGFEDSSIMLWSVNRSTQIGRKPYAALRDRQCHWNVTACDSSFSEDEEAEEEGDGEEQQEDDEGGGRESDDPGEASGLRNFTETGGVTLRGHSNAVTDLLFSAHTPLLLSVSRDLTMRAWQASDYNCRAVYRGHNHPIWSVAESPTGLYLATGSRDTTARLWCTDREFPLQIYVGHTQDVDTVAFHPNGNYLATGSTDLTVRLWCVTSGKLFRIFTDCRQPVNRISFSPDGKYLAAAGEENRVRIFDLAAGSQLTELREHSSPVTCVTWSANSRHFVSAGADGTVRVWDALKMVSTSSSSSSSSSTAAANNSPNPAANGAHNHTNHSQKTPTSSGSSSSSSNNLLLAYSTGCRRIYRLHYNQLNGSLCCIGNS